jgi:hypothetical protein
MSFDIEVGKLADAKTLDHGVEHSKAAIAAPSSLRGYLYVLI